MTDLVHVKTLKGGGIGNPLMVNAGQDTVGCLKQSIASRLGASAADMKLVFKAKPLFDETVLLRDAGIQGVCTVHLVYRVHGGAQ